MKDQCSICANDGNDYCFACDNGNRFKAVSNADRIRAMTDEELAEMFDEYGKRNDVCPKFGAYSCHDENCYDCWLDWLKKEVYT